MDAEKKKHFDVGIDEISKSVASHVKDPKPCMLVTFARTGIHMISAAVTNHEIALFVQIAIENDPETKQFVKALVKSWDENENGKETIQ